MKKYVIGLDIGGTKINCVLADLEGNILKHRLMPTDANKGEEFVLNNIIKDISYVQHDKPIETIKAIGIGIAGVLDIKNGIVIESPNLPFKNFSLVNKLKEKFNTDVYIENDGNVAAIGEYTKGSGVGTNNMLYVTVSTGIGGGAVLNGKLYKGNGNAFEIGHMTIKPNGEKCKCGNYGCLEVLTSGTTIGNIGKKYVANRWNTALVKYDTITAREVFEEASNGDAVSQMIINESMNYLGIGIANLVNIFNPDMIIIGGGVSQAGDIVFDRVREVVDQRCFKSVTEHCKIVPASLGSDAGVIGAVMLVLNEGEI